MIDPRRILGKKETLKLIRDTEKELFGIEPPNPLATDLERLKIAVELRNKLRELYDKSIKVKGENMAKELNYMAIDREGRFVAVIAPHRQKEVAEETGKWIRQGLSVQRCSDDYVRKHFGDIVKPPKRDEDIVWE